MDREMARSINEIGHLTGKQTIAERAENGEIFEVLRGLGVDYAQGCGVSPGFAPLTGAGEVLSGAIPAGAPPGTAWR
jgi:EAL domain-containing protein (putative c-di-GMP-specific phosphodiesterase class I)